MRETPADFNARRIGGARPYLADNLSSFRWHTGATLRPLAAEAACPVLFRDIGPAALVRFLRGELRRLAGPLSPLVHMRTADYIEPYIDHESTGRLVLLQPLALQPWHAGTPYVFVARARPDLDSETVGFVPGGVSLSVAADLARDVNDVQQWRETMGGRLFDEAVAASLANLDRIAEELACTEKRAAPLRRRLQAPDRRTRERALEEMTCVGLTEADLCTAWHHLSRERRRWIAEVLDSSFRETIDQAAPRAAAQRGNA